MNCRVKSYMLMGCSFELGIIEKDKQKAYALLDEGADEIRRIENLLSEFKPESLVSSVNRNAGIRAIKINQELFRLLDRSLKISKLSRGYFDITIGPLKKLYTFSKDRFNFPDKKIISEALKRTGFQKVILNEKASSVFLSEKNMEISFAANGKGYAADAVKKLWQKKGVQAGYINASGDLTAFGRNAKGDAWKIGIANPDNRMQILFYVPLINASVATSGDYEQYFIADGKRYSHTLNPMTGMPLQGIKSVSVFSPSAELSDALATAIYVMGINKGLSFTDQLINTYAIIIDEKNKIHFSKNLVYKEVA